MTDDVELGEMERATEPPMDFLKFGRFNQLEAEYARPILNAAEREMWSVRSDGRLQLRPEVDEASLPPDVRGAIKRGRGNGKFF